MKSVQEGGDDQLCQKLLMGQVRFELETIVFSNDVDTDDPEESNFSGVRWAGVLIPLGLVYGHTTLNAPGLV